MAELLPVLVAMRRLNVSRILQSRRRALRAPSECVSLVRLWRDSRTSSEIPCGSPGGEGDQ